MPPSHPLGEQLQHLPGALGPPGRQGAGARLVQLPHQRLRLLHRQLAGAAPEALQVGQQGGEVLVRDLEGAGRSSGRSVETPGVQGSPRRAAPRRRPPFPAQALLTLQGLADVGPPETMLTVGRSFFKERTLLGQRIQEKVDSVLGRRRMRVPGPRKRKQDPGVLLSPSRPPARRGLAARPF